MKNIILITKDAQVTNYYPVYGNNYWKTPNIDELAKKGTLFLKHYTTAPSTAMAFSGMFLEKYPLYLDRLKYEHVHDVDEKDTFFYKLEMLGYKNHIIWDEHYNEVAFPFCNCFGSKTTFHTPPIAQNIGPHLKNRLTVIDNDELAEKTLSVIFNNISDIVSSGELCFVWIHLPHVILGRSCYGGDIDLVDRIVGFARKLFDDDSIFFSADHGNMNSIKGKMCYGFDVYEPAIRIPLITPKVSSLSIVDWPTSSIQLGDIIINRTIKKLDFIVSDDAYYGQPNRKIAIIHGKYKYIYNKKSQSEELYDIEYDLHEDCNLLQKNFYDTDRKVFYRLNEIYYYPYWDEAENEFTIIKDYFNKIWREAPKSFERRQRFKNCIKSIIQKLKRKG